MAVHLCSLYAMAKPVTDELAEPPGVVAMSPSERIAGIRPEILNRAGLRMAWPYDGLLSDSDDHVVKLFYHHGQLFILSQKKILYALNGKNGTINWTCILSQFEMEDTPISHYDDLLVMVFGNTCVEIREQTGEIVRQITFDFDVMTNVARNSDRLFVGARNQRLYSVRRSDGIPLWQTVCNGRPIGAIAVQDNRVYFTAQDNTLYVSLTDKRLLLWHAQAVGELCGVVVNKNQCFMPSQDTALYCLEARSGELLWKIRTGSALTVLPTVTKKWVYQPVSYESLLCIDREDGAAIWELPKGRCFLAENGSESFAMTDNAELTRMDNKRGRRLASIYVHHMNHFVQNDEDAMIFMSSEQGHMLALEPLEHAPVETEPEEEPVPVEPI